MTYIKINNNLYLAEINGVLFDTLWNNRMTKSITLEMDYNTASSLFVDDVQWSIVYTDDETGETQEYDNSDFCIAGPITDNRDGTLTIKMGKFTNEELLLMEVLK